MQPDAPVNPLQVFVVGAAEQWSTSFMKSAATGEASCVALRWEDWASTSWQTQRTVGRVWAILYLADDGIPFDEVCRWLQLLSVTLRPSRLLVLGPELPLDQSIAYVRAGADGLLHRDSDPGTIANYLNNASTNVQRLLPDPSEWLLVLRRVGEELLESPDLDQALAKLLRLCCTRVQADRATLFLRQGAGNAVQLIAGVGLPEDLTIGSTIIPTGESITAWVLEHGKPLLTQGRNVATRTNPRTPIRSGISAPLMSQGRALGVVNVSRVDQSSDFSPSDLSMIEVFAQMAGFAVANQRLVQAALDAQRLAVIGRTTADISHCVKNILQSVKGGVSLARMGLANSDAEGLTAGLDLAYRGSERLGNLVLELLEFSKVREPELVPVLPGQVVKEIIEECGVATGAGGVEIVPDCDPLPMLLLDGDRLYRALANLVRNSCDALNGTGTIFVRVRKRGQFVSFTVEDDGLGVPDDILRNLFQPFFSTKGSKGTGLGLAMVRKFAEENRGAARAWNREEGGFAVEITLPLVAVE